MHLKVEIICNIRANNQIQTCTSYFSSPTPFALLAGQLLAHEGVQIGGDRLHHYTPLQQDTHSGSHLVLALLAGQLLAHEGVQIGGGGLHHNTQPHAWTRGVCPCKAAVVAALAGPPSAIGAALGACTCVCMCVCKAAKLACQVSSSGSIGEHVPETPCV